MVEPYVRERNLKIYQFINASTVIYKKHHLPDQSTSGKTSENKIQYM
jgi:hypothetical protein